ncbi:hypothetical protein LOTGIDRAFT_168232 [Lottia gigantea]|uniref:Uncharacterized protein n=1 Tax=Lottia gigantea TaxID=225164 RepID=V4B8C6_LOTGI|nr:hypothetical protein LOTGIDRAFT_168232 [Lottia gigantea]ESO84974.1 hypothetical protein LOTGIDRAFT_168232 [Lottia gigantea]
MSGYNNLVYLVFCFTVFLNISNVASLVTPPIDQCNLINGMDRPLIIPDSSISTFPYVDPERVRAGEAWFIAGIKPIIIINLSLSSTEEVEIRSVSVNVWNVEFIDVTPISSNDVEKTSDIVTKRVSGLEASISFPNDVTADKIRIALSPTDSNLVVGITSKLDVRACFQKPDKVHNLAVISIDNNETFAVVTWKCPVESSLFIRGYELTSSLDVVVTYF